METWKVIKELKECPEKKFECNLGQIENFKGDIIWSTSMNKLVLNSITLNQEWKEIQKPITFIEAVKSEKSIKVEHHLLHKSFSNINCLLYHLYNNFGVSDVRDIILNGKYYILKWKII